MHTVGKIFGGLFCILFVSFTENFNFFFINRNVGIVKYSIDLKYLWLVWEFWEHSLSFTFIIYKEVFCTICDNIKSNPIGSYFIARLLPWGQVKQYMSQLHTFVMLRLCCQCCDILHFVLTRGHTCTAGRKTSYTGEKEHAMPRMHTVQHPSNAVPLKFTTKFLIWQRPICSLCSYLIITRANLVS